MYHGEMLTPKQKKWAYDKWCEGYTIAEIGDALYCSTATVRRAFKGKPKIKPKLHYDFESEVNNG